MKRLAFVALLVASTSHADPIASLEDSVWLSRDLPFEPKRSDIAEAERQRYELGASGIVAKTVESYRTDADGHVVHAERRATPSAPPSIVSDATYGTSSHDHAVEDGELQVRLGRRRLAQLVGRRAVPATARARSTTSSRASARTTVGAGVRATEREAPVVVSLEEGALGDVLVRISSSHDRRPSVYELEWEPLWSPALRGGHA